MKRFLAKLTPLAILICLFACLVGCTQKRANGVVARAEPELLIIDVTSADEGATLRDVMNKMQEDGKIVFTEDGSGMIRSINGYFGDGGYWMLYTSSVEFSNNAWGTYTYEGGRYGSAMFGYESLPVDVGERYLWVYTVL